MRLVGRRVQDRRIQKTRMVLREALFSLIREKDYDSIVVKEILDRANVGRSTFYAHFRDKDELLVSGMHDMLRSAQATVPPSSGKDRQNVIWFSLPIFEHISQHRLAGRVKIGVRGRTVIHEHLKKVLAALIVRDVKESFKARRNTTASIPLDLFVQYVASTFILVLNWWMEQRSAVSPEEINDLFRSIISPVLAETFESRRPG
jgi:AcrR family transcriptional regulator